MENFELSLRLQIDQTEKELIVIEAGNTRTINSIRHLSNWKKFCVRS